jgi:hypothetical protein
MLLRSLVVFILSGCPVFADSAISAAGRMEIVGRGATCSASLIRPDLIATAAHCVINHDQVFRPGDGLAGAIFLIEDKAIHPLYKQSKSRVEWKIRFDVAVGQLSKSVPSERATPLPIGDEAIVGETLYVVSWRRDGTKLPRQRPCDVLAGDDGLVTLGCQVQGGESGAPVLRKTEDGYELVAIVSSRTWRLDQPVAKASNVRLRLPPLLDQIDAKTP